MSDFLIGRPTALNDPVGNFEKEILNVGHASVHDKIVVINPPSDDCIIAAGSHKLDFKASYENDENLLAFTGNKALACAKAVHTLDVDAHCAATLRPTSHSQQHRGPQSRAV